MCAAEEEELRTNSLEEEEGQEKEKDALGDLGDGRMGQSGASEWFNLN